MWTLITSPNQVKSLASNDELLHHPCDGGLRVDNPTGFEKNSQVYTIKQIEDDLLILYFNGTSSYSSRGVSCESIVEGEWWLRTKKANDG